MAGAGYKLFTTGQVLTAAEVNTYLQEQVIMVFASATARTTALSGVLSEGMVSYLKDTNATEVYDGSAWVGIGNSGDITGITTGATSGLTGGVTSGTADLKLNTTAKGGLLVGTGSGTVSELSVGSNTQILTADSTTATGLKWASAASSPTFVGCSLYKGSAQSVSSTTTTYLSFDTEDFDTDGFHDNSTNNTRITIPSGKGGYYLLIGRLEYVSYSTGIRECYFFKNRTQEYQGCRLSAASDGPWDATISAIVNASAGDYFEFVTYQTSGIALNSGYTRAETTFSCQYLGA